VTPREGGPGAAGGDPSASLLAWARLVRTAGWDATIAELERQALAPDAQLMLTFLCSDRTSWRFLLKAGRWNRVLCLDTRLGGTAAAIAGRCGELILAGYEQDLLGAAAERLRVAEAGRVECTLLSRDSRRLPFPDGHFDIVIADDFGAVLAHLRSYAGARRRVLGWLGSEFFRVLADDGAGYFALARRMGLLRLAKSGAGPGEPVSQTSYSTPLRLHRSLRSAGFRDLRLYPLLLHHNRLREVLQPTQHTSARLSLNRREKTMGVLAGSGLAHHVTDGVAVVARKDKAGSTFLETLVSELESRHAPSQGDRRRLAVKRFFVLPSKAIASIGKDGEAYGEWITVLPLNQTELERRRHEGNVLRGLQDARLPMSPLVPRFLGEGSLEGQPYVVQSEIRGVVVGTAIPRFEELARGAVAALTAFHASTIRDVTVDDLWFDALFGEPLRRVEAQLGPESAPGLDSVRRELRTRLAGRTVRTVWTHGDYKIENVLFDPRSLAVRGVIDWDLSERHGLPLLDLLYLIAYNRIITQQQTIDRIVLDTILPPSFTPEEDRLYSGYAGALGLSSDHLPALHAMFWIHHMAYRVKVGAGLHQLVARMLSVVDEIAHRLSHRG